MWKVLLLLACVAGSTIVFCDASSDCDASGSGSVDTLGFSPTFKCGPNQVFSNCTNGGCDARYCSQAGKPVACVKLDPKNCKKGCVCADGYLRTAKGICVLKNQCNEGCGDDRNSHPGCGVNCGRTCSTYKKKIVPCILICNSDGCDCNDGYVYDPNVKKCVLPKDCTPTCGLYEVYSTCTNGGCSHRYCSQLGKPQICIRRTPESCTKGCVCADGFLRDANGTCVPEKQCPQAGCGDDPNAQPGCGYNCRKKCSDYKSKNRFLCPRQVCKPDKCDCKDGYVLDENVKKCVLPEQCTPICGLNEKYTACVNGGCGHKNCSQIGTPQVCVKINADNCIKGCICTDGYLRAANGTCVPEKQCPVTGCGGDPYAKSGCGVNCGKTCTTYKAKHPICPQFCKVGGCDCIDGYVYDGNVKKCVLPKDCTATCQINEVYDVCPAPCPPRRCDVDDRLIDCVAPPRPGDAACKPGCRCADGYARLANGTCVLRDQCEQPLQCDYENNEVYDSCPPACPGDSCDVDPAVVQCARVPEYGDPQCKPACRCIDGYARNADNNCVPRDQCPPKTDDWCPGQNEFYDTCISGCSNQSCDSIGKIFHCPIQPAVCREGCRCNPGFYRNADNVCVAESECPLQCNYENNEVYVSCPPACPGDSCDVDPALVLCGPTNPEYGDPQCKPACRCIDGYARNAANKCVPRDQCPPKTDDQCLGQNEFYDTCISGCSNQSCDSIGKIFHCPIQTAVCREGCRCNPGFYRNADNVCVAESQCPAPSCPDGETYSRCPTVKCEGDYCQKTRDSPTRCPVGIVCDPARCVCALGRRRDHKTGKCIQAQDCPPFKCDGPNEEYKSCPATCPSDKCSDYVAGQRCPQFFIGIYLPCAPQCRCKKGYYRDNAGVCILASRCKPANPTTNTPVIIEPVTTETPSTGSNDNGLASLQTGITNFNGKFLYERMKAETGKNLITSPSSVITPLVQMALYADGDSFKQLASVLNVATKEQIRTSFPAYIASFDGQTSVNFSTAAKVYSNINYPLSDGFKKDSVDVVHAEAQDLDFSKNTEAADIINSWVEDKTNNRIHDLLQASDLSPLTRLVLINAIYFKGDWHYAFNKTDTVKDTDFYLSDGSTKKTDLMYQQRQFNYGEIPELNCTVLQMFYKGDNFSMVVVLPNEIDGIMPVAEKLQDKANFDKVLGSLTSQKVKVYLPPFKIETTTDLASILKQVGITNIFSAGNSGLSGMLKTPEDTSVTKAVQKAFIEVNEEGTEAAAANAVVVGVTAVFHPQPPKEIIFRCDHSFLYYIVCNDNVLFAGSLVDRD